MIDNILEQALCGIRRVLRAAEFGSRELAKKSGLTPSQVVVLQIVYRREDCTPGDIADCAKVGMPTVTALVQRLEQAELVERVRDTNDGRRVTIQITDQGRRVLLSIPDILQDRFSSRFKSLEDWEQASIVAALARVTALLDAAEIDAAPILDVGSLDRAVEPPKADS